MKRLILAEILLLFLATTFKSDGTGGWVQQSIPIGNKLITDIQFLDSSNGWVVTNWGPSFDTAYVLKTTDGGSNWIFQYRFHGSFTAIQMTDNNTGYIVGSTGSGKIWKTTNGGNNWSIQSTFCANPIEDLSFVNGDTGWICSDDVICGGLFKTTNGGVNWQGQLAPSFHIIKLFFINKDTGWAGSSDWKLYKTTNGGTNWSLQFTTTIAIGSIFFLTPLKGWIRGGGSSNGVLYTTDGGSSWNNAQGNTAAGFDLRFVNDSIGYSGMQSFRIPKSTDGGKTWGYQTSPIQNNMSVYMFKNDTMNGWAGGTGIVHTGDGGGLINGVEQISSEIPKDYKLFQNYPNPFNPHTVISYQLRVNSYTELILYDITGKHITDLVNQKQMPGTYEVDFDGSNLPSGVYFYQLIITNKQSKDVFKETKKMILLK